MSEYGPGMTIGGAGELDKERVRHALDGELICGESERGFGYAPAPKEECDAYILSVVDKWVYQAKELADSGRAVERVMAAHGWRMPFGEYIAAMDEASREYNDYLYEDDLAELHEEADRMLEGGAE